MPAPPELRLKFLKLKSGALGNRMPIDLLKNDREYRTLRAFAKAWATVSAALRQGFYCRRSSGLGGSGASLHMCNLTRGARRGSAH